MSQIMQPATFLSKFAWIVTKLLKPMISPKIEQHESDCNDSDLRKLRHVGSASPVSESSESLEKNVSIRNSKADQLSPCS